MGSAGVATLIAHVVFVVVLILGWEDLGPRGGTLFLVLWLAAFLGREYVPYGPLLFTPYLAILDIVLVLIVFKGDVRLR
jgi:hypothetical protein